MSAAKPVYLVLPASTTSDGQLRTPFTSAIANWTAYQRTVALEVIERHVQRGIVRHEGEIWVTRWHVRVVATWVAGILRCDAREMIELADAQHVGGADQ